MLCHVSRAHHLLNRVSQHQFQLHQVNLDHLQLSQYTIDIFRMVLELGLQRN